jgi:hypothetical protein
VCFTQRIISALLTVIWPFASFVDSLSLAGDWDAILVFVSFDLIYSFFCFLRSSSGGKVLGVGPLTLVFPQGFPNVVTQMRREGVLRSDVRVVPAGL